MGALLGVQTHFTFHWGTASPAAWLDRAAALGFTHVGFADLAGVHGLPEILKVADKHRVKPLHGATFPFSDGRSVMAFIHAPAGYGNLCQRITEWVARCAAERDPYAGGAPILDAGKARRTWLDFAQEHTEGLVFITNDKPTWDALLAAGAETYWRIGPTLASPPRGVDLAATVFAPGPCFLSADDYLAHRLLRAIGGATSLDRIPAPDRRDRKAPVATATLHDVVRSAADYADRLSMYPEAFDRAEALAERLARFTPCRNTLYPPLPATTPEQAGESAMVRLQRLAYEGAKIRFGERSDAVKERLEYELGLIERKGFAEYFLVVHDIVGRLAGGDARKRRGRSITCGRGSGAASLVNYCLGVTNVDALKHNLMFERFLNEARQDPPDIDVDFAWDERDDVLARVFAEYGRQRVARVANHNRYDWRGAFRAAARTLGYADPEITRHIKTSPSIYNTDPESDVLPEPGRDAPDVSERAVVKLGLLKRKNDTGWNEAAKLARLLYDKPHGLSMHCGGLVISTGKICRTVPTFISGKGQPTIQWEKDGSEDMGLVKIDLLGNRSLAVIRDAVAAIHEDYDIPEHEVIKNDPTDDKDTCDLVARGDTFGVFYLESPAMRLLLAKAKKGDFAHTVIHSSIIRPAANAFINEYLERLHGKPWKAQHERLDGVFDESYGIPVYQEDVVKLAMHLADWDYTRADGLRKCLGKRDAMERLTTAFPALADDARKLGVDDETLKGFWRTLMSMTGYSFCKPHSASFAMVSYESAFLRAHYPAHFIAAVLSNGGGFYSTQAYVSEAMRLGLRVLGPDVNASDADWRAEGPQAIRTGLAAISGLSQAAVKAILAARGERRKPRPFRGLEDFLERVRPHADDCRRLALVGAFDTLAEGLNRPQLLWCAAQAAREPDAPARKRQGNLGTGSLFGPYGGDGVEVSGNRMIPPRLPPYTLRQRHEAEYSALGFLPGSHPLALFEEDIRAGAERYRRRRNPALTSAGRLHEHVGKLVSLLAWPVTAKIVETKHGDAMMFQSFEDHRAICEAVLFPQEFRRFHRLLSTAQPLWVTGRVEAEFDVPTLHVLAVERAVGDVSFTSTPSAELPSTAEGGRLSLSI